MHSNKALWGKILIVFAAALLATPAVFSNGNGKGRGQGSGPQYFDPATVTTLSGTLTMQYTDWQPRGNGNFCGTGQHFEFTADGGGIYSLILGPAWFLEESGVSLNVGDRITVTGSVVDAYISGFSDEFLIAVSITFGGTTVELRDGSGFPLWRGGNGGNGQGIGRGLNGLHFFEPDTVDTFKGMLVESLNYWVGYGDGNYTGNGMHYLFETRGGESFYLMLGPWWYLEQNGIELEPGDDITVTGSVVEPYFNAYADHDFLIASEIVVNGKTLELRDEEGYPLWRNGNRYAYQSPAYSADSLETISGTVQKVYTRSYGSNLDAGLQLKVRDGNKRYNVYLGPQYYCESLDLSVAKGDQVRLRGSVSKRDFIASDLQVGGKSYKFRNRSGNPLWVQGE